MQPSTLLKFLFGNRQAIIDIATCRGSLLLGGLLVLSAGFAREYDGEDLLHAPWYLLVPLVASLATCTLLYCLLYLAAQKQAEPAPTFAAFFPRFLSLYWMTAPLAWLYAIPVEQFLEPAGAVRFNLTLLGIVSLWRVLLITRCASDLFGSSYRAAFFLVMLFADTVALGILLFTPLPIFDIMGGIHLTDSESLILDTALMIGFLGTLTWPVWLIASTVVIWREKRDWKPLEFYESATKSISIEACASKATARPTEGRVQQVDSGVERQVAGTSINKSLWGIALAALLIWIPILPYSQPPLRLARQVEVNLKEGRVAEAVQQMSAHDRDSFPPHWDPPPWPGYGDRTPPLHQVLQEISEGGAAPWVRDAYLEKFTRKMERRFRPSNLWRSMEDEEFEQYLAFLESSPETLEVARQYSDTFVELINDPEEDENAWRYVSPERKELVRSLLETLALMPPEVAYQ